MEFSGRLSVDAPDPNEGNRLRAQELGLDLVGFSRQRHLEDWGALSIREHTQHGEQAPREVDVSKSYTLWRNPDDHDDPFNLRPTKRASAAPDDADPALPTWLHERVRRMKYPLLWEAVRTHRARPPHRRTAEELLVEHLNYVLNNQFRTEHQLPPLGAGSWASLVSTRGVRSDYPVTVDGTERPGFLADTDPFVVGLAADLDAERTFTAVIPRDALPYLDLSFDDEGTPPPAAAGDE